MIGRTSEYHGRKFIKTTVFAGAALASGSVGRGASGVDSETSLRLLSKNLFPVGVSLRNSSEGGYTPLEKEVLGRHFDIITPETAMKWECCQPDARMLIPALVPAPQLADNTCCVFAFGRSGNSVNYGTSGD